MKGKSQYEKLLVSLVEETDSEETNEWVGFIKTIKIFINQKHGKTIERLEAKFEGDIKRLEAGQAEMKAILEAILIKLIEKK